MSMGWLLDSLEFGRMVVRKTGVIINKLIVKVNAEE